MRLCDAGETEGDVTHFILAVPSLIWTVSGRVGGQGGPLVLTREPQNRKRGRSESLNMSVFIPFSFGMKPAPELRAYTSVLWAIGVHQLMVQPDLFNMCPWKFCL